MQRRAPPETPRCVQNPFESPGDVRHLQEQTVCSPSAFRAAQPAGSPGRFGWSIDDLALIDPVEIDSEDIRRQAFYLSQARVDREVEERRQRAIEEFFTKSLIVPSPWTDPVGKEASQLNSTRRVDLNNASPVGRETDVLPGKNNAACQTALSLPVDFDMEKILGDYFKADELADQSQESLSSSSLRRKLFLDENGSLSSEHLSPSPSLPDAPASLGILCSIDLSPVRCRSPLSSSSSGHLSSSPIWGNTRASSLPSPSCTSRSRANLASPTFSPVGIQLRKTSLADARQFTFRSPDLPSAPNACRLAPAGARSPYMECSPVRLPSSCRGATLYRSSLLPRLPCTPENLQEELAEAAKPSSAGSPRACLPPPNGAASSAGPRLAVAAPVAASADPAETGPKGLAPGPSLDCSMENRMEELADPEVLDENSVKGSAESDEGTVAGLSLEGSCICLAALAESSGLQMDSGYNTQSYTSSLMDTVVAELSCREQGAHEAHKKYIFRMK